MPKRIVDIHQNPSWPEFTWNDETVAAPLAAVRHKQGRLLGRMEGLGFDLRVEASLTVLTSDVVQSSAIEGEDLDTDEVRSSIARRLGLDLAGLPKASRDVEGVVEMMLDGTRHFEKALTERRLFDWHASLFPTGRSGLRRITVGAWQTKAAGPMQVVSGAAGREKVYFEAPEAGRLENEMARFLRWFNAPAADDPVLKAAIAHFWFVTIHPFEDGNGRIARAIADMALARADGTKDRFYSMSTQIAAERKDYYRRLEAAQRGGVDITTWLVWFLGCLDRAIDGADHAIGTVRAKARLWQTLNRQPVNERHRSVINRLPGDFEGALTTSKYATLASCSTDTALRDIRELLERGVLIQNAGGGRSTSYARCAAGGGEGRSDPCGSWDNRKSLGCSAERSRRGERRSGARGCARTEPFAYVSDLLTRLAEHRDLPAERKAAEGEAFLRELLPAARVASNPQHRLPLAR